MITIAFVPEINHYYMNELHLFWDTTYQWKEQSNPFTLEQTRYRTADHFFIDFEYFQS